MAKDRGQSAGRQGKEGDSNEAFSSSLVADVGQVADP